MGRKGPPPPTRQLHDNARPGNPIFLLSIPIPAPAWELYFLLGQDREYLRRLQVALEGHDGYLWATRDHDHNGCLEALSGLDTGEDHRFRWPQDPKDLPDRAIPPRDRSPNFHGWVWVAGGRRKAEGAGKRGIVMGVALRKTLRARRLRRKTPAAKGEFAACGLRG